MRLIAALLVSVLATQAVARERYEGRYAREGVCKPRPNHPEDYHNLLTVGKNFWKGWEERCTFTKVTPARGLPDRWNVVAHCVSEGDSGKENFVLETTTVNDILMIENSHATLVYQRCD